MSLPFRQLIGQPIVGLQSGLTGYQLKACLIDPDTNKIGLLIIGSSLGSSHYYVLPQAVRGIDRDSIVVNSEEDISDNEDLVRYQPLIRFGAKLIGAKVKTINDTKLGTIIDFSFDKTTFDICKLEVRSRWLLMPLAKNLIITRKQIIKIERDVVTVKENTVKNQKAAPELLPVSS